MGLHYDFIVAMERDAQRCSWDGARLGSAPSAWGGADALGHSVRLPASRRNSRLSA